MNSGVFGAELYSARILGNSAQEGSQDTEAQTTSLADREFQRTIDHLAFCLQQFPASKIGILVGRGTAADLREFTPNLWWQSCKSLLKESEESDNDTATLAHEMNHGVSSSSEEITWIPCDAFGGAFPPGTSCHHLWMDFNDFEKLAKLPTASVDVITIDWSTWRYMRPLKAQLPTQDVTPGWTVMDEWQRILKPNGTLVFETSAASVMVVDNRETSISSFPQHLEKCDEVYTFEFDNPCHITVPTSAARILLSSSNYAPAGRERSLPSLSAKTVSLSHLLHKPAAEPFPFQRKILSALPAQDRAMASKPKHKDVVLETSRLLAESVQASVDRILISMFDISSTRHSGWATVSLHNCPPDAYPIQVRGHIPRWAVAVKR